MAPPVDLDGLSPAELKAWVGVLLEKIAGLEQKLRAQREEIARLKGLKGRPEIKPSKPSGMEQASSATSPKTNDKRRRGRSKPAPVAPVEDRVVRAQVPVGSRFKGHEIYVVQDLEIRPRVIRYRRERWLTPDGHTMVAPLPVGTTGHFGPELRRFVLAQYHQGQSLPRRRSG
jgi:hypothetical protein